MKLEHFIKHKSLIFEELHQLEIFLFHHLDNFINVHFWLTDVIVVDVDMVSSL